MISILLTNIKRIGTNIFIHDLEIKLKKVFLPGVAVNKSKSTFSTW